MLYYSQVNSQKVDATPQTPKQKHGQGKPRETRRKKKKYEHKISLRCSQPVPRESLAPTTAGDMHRSLSGILPSCCVCLLYNRERHPKIPTPSTRGVPPLLEGHHYESHENPADRARLPESVISVRLRQQRKCLAIIRVRCFYNLRSRLRLKAATQVPPLSPFQFSIRVFALRTSPRP